MMTDLQTAHDAVTAAIADGIDYLEAPARRIATAALAALGIPPDTPVDHIAAGLDIIKLAQRSLIAVAHWDDDIWAVEEYVTDYDADTSSHGKTLGEAVNALMKDRQ